MVPRHGRKDAGRGTRRGALLRLAVSEVQVPDEVHQLWAVREVHEGARCRELEQDQEAAPGSQGSSMSYGKIFESMFNGSMVGSGPVVFAVWSYVIAHAKPPGTVELNPVLLAAIIGCEVSSVETAIAHLCAPDPRSRSPEQEGRRLIQEGQFLYSVPTWPKYREMRNEEARREYERNRKRNWRGRSRDVPDSPGLHGTTGDIGDMSAQAEALSEALSEAPAAHTEGVGAGVLVGMLRESAYGESRSDRELFLVAEASRLHRAGLTPDRLSDLISDCCRRARKSPGGLLATLLRGDGWKEREVRDVRHVQNMPLGAASCSCSECVRFRRKQSKDSA